MATASRSHAQAQAADSAEQSAKVRFLDKLKKGTRPAVQRFHSVPILQMRAHEEQVLVPEPKARSAASSTGKMVNCAFEVTKDGEQFVHPVDQPITLSNGKNLYPNGEKDGAGAPKHSDDLLAKDMMALLSVIANNLVHLATYIWKLDLYVNVSVSETTSVRIHVPTVVVGAVLLKVLLSQGSSHQSVPTANGGLSIVSLVLMASLGYYVFSMLQQQDLPSEKTHAFDTANAKSIPKIPDLESVAKPNKGCKPTDYDVIHRHQVPKKEALHINAPPNKDSINRHVMSRLTREARDEMMRVFD